VRVCKVGGKDFFDQLAALDGLPRHGLLSGHRDDWNGKQSVVGVGLRHWRILRRLGRR
jgi:hypothetical protein